MVDFQTESNIEEMSFHLTHPFITISLPLVSESFEDPYIILEELVCEAKRQLFETSKECSFEKINKRLNKLKVKLPPQNLFKSFVALISEDSEEVIPLHVAVEKKVHVGAAFDVEEIRNLKKDSHGAENETTESDPISQVIYERYCILRPFGKRTY